ncbi:uroporphyrinogen-III C-methyltransferase [Lyngbya confervoides]|uniref:uroporphyrinogen-III C-methyltransferase n=1 Tax=Lyngbya confervoides BDU141951 TaxID=1574623 RepID=A0ABD4SYW0_9CYAN|nr:uroporphyrinogen-III C-methyltransferase [Lyngbya confervoides]MCM1981502.1 uroporphyrinogen-III C-methyltransferase [Lyngbya confervoides BDU141951]
MSQVHGRVDILGAGPGDPGLLTLVGQELLAQAEVLIYDALVDPFLLTFTKENCQRHRVGKRGGQPSWKQADINRLLVEIAQQGKRVVRLKSGDPFVFGRTATEVEALNAVNCPVYVWPGISSVLAAPLLAGIPVTDPDTSQVVTLVSGHAPATLNWQAIAASDTQIILMGMRTLPDLRTALLNAGKSPQTPVAVIRGCSWPHQECWIGTLDTLTPPADPLAPAVIVVGKVVEKRRQLRLSNCLDASPRSQILRGRHILVTRAAGQSSSFRDQLTNLGAQVTEMPALEIVAPTRWEDLDQAIEALATYHWLILTSANAVQFFFHRLSHWQLDSRALGQVKVAVVGRKTADQLTQFGIRPDYIPPNFIADDLAANFPGGPDLSAYSILLPRVESGGRDLLVQSLQAQGAQVTEVAAYQSQCPTHIPPTVVDSLQTTPLDAITFASSKTVRHTVQLLNSLTHQVWNQSAQDWLKSTCIASIGPQTSKTCRDLLGRVDVEPKEYTLDSLTQALVQYFQDHEGPKPHP